MGPGKNEHPILQSTSLTDCISVEVVLLTIINCSTVVLKNNLSKKYGTLTTEKNFLHLHFKYSQKSNFMQLCLSKIAIVSYVKKVKCYRAKVAQGLRRQRHWGADHPVLN